MPQLVTLHHSNNATLKLTPLFQSRRSSGSLATHCKPFTANQYHCFKRD